MPSESPLPVDKLNGALDVTDGSDHEQEVLLGVLSKVKAGDFTARMPVHWTGHRRQGRRPA